MLVTNRRKEIMKVSMKYNQILYCYFSHLSAIELRKFITSKSDGVGQIIYKVKRDTNRLLN